MYKRQKQRRTRMKSLQKNWRVLAAAILAAALFTGCKGADAVKEEPLNTYTAAVSYTHLFHHARKIWGAMPEKLESPVPDPVLTQNG